MDKFLQSFRQSYNLNKRRVLFFFGVMALLVSADLIIKAQVEKNWVRPWSPEVSQVSDEILVSFPNNPDPENTLFLTKEIVVIEGFWSFIYVRNYNIGFSLLGFIENHLSPEAQVTFFKFFQLFGFLLVFAFFFYNKMENYFSFLLILSGGVGNVADRWIRGYVVDYVKWYIPDSSIALFNPWPIFNLADSLITVGIFSLIISYFFLGKNKTDQADQTNQSSGNNEEADRVNQPDKNIEQETI